MRKWFLRLMGYIEVPAVDPITELTNAIRRCSSITKLQPELRKICWETVRAIDEFGKFDQEIYEESPITKRSNPEVTA